MRHILFPGCLLAALAGAAMAQTAAPSTESMIQQLAPPRTRSLLGTVRNLVPERAAPTAQAAASAPAAPEASGAATPAPTAAAAASAATADTAPAAPVARPSLSLLIQFDFDSARVRPESRQALANLSEALQSAELRDSRFAIEGHTDAKGSAEYNRRLSEQRALAVRDYLLDRGVAADRLDVAGKGAAELANTAEPFAAENRRVRIVNLE